MTPAHRFARVLVLPSTSAAEPRALRHAASTAPRCSSGLEMSACPPCQRIGQFATGCLALLRPALRQYAEHEPDAFDRLLLPTILSTTSTRAAFVPSISSRLAPRPFALGLHPGRGRLGDLAVQDAGSASAGGSGFFARRFFFRALPVLPCF